MNIFNAYTHLKFSLRKMEQENLYDSSCTTLTLVKLIPCEEEMCLIVLIMHLSTKQLTVALNFHSMGGGYGS